MKPYTRRQRDIMEFIAQYQVAQGVSPTMEEIAHEFGVHRVTIFQHLNALERRGALQRSAQLARSVEILDPDFLPEPSLPILGRIAAGAPIEALEEPEYVDDAAILPKDGEHYALRVTGDSMIEDGIHDGDLVIVRRSRRPRNGDVVVAVVASATGGSRGRGHGTSDGADEGANEVTLKRFFRERDGRIRLQPANATMDPIIVDQAEIRGIVTSVIRQL